MQVQRRAVLRVHVVAAQRAGAGAPGRRVHGQEQVALPAQRQLVDELDAHRPAAAGADERPEVVDRRGADRVAAARVGARVELHVAAEPGRGEVAVQLLRVLAHGDLVVVGAGVGDRVRRGDRDVLAEVVGRGRADAGQLVHELADLGAVRPVGDAAEVVGSGVRIEARRRRGRLAGHLLAGERRRVEALRLAGGVRHHRHEVARAVGDGSVGDAGVDAGGAARGDAGLRRVVVAGAAAGGQAGGQHGRRAAARPRRRQPDGPDVQPRLPDLSSRPASTLSGRAQNATIQSLPHGLRRRTGPAARKGFS